MHNIITAFFLVVVFVTVLLLLIYFNYEGVVRKQQLSEAPHFLQNNTVYKDRIENCLGLAEKKELAEINMLMPQCIPLGAKGFFIERLDGIECTYARLEAGEFEDCKHILTFYLNLKEDNTKNCLSRLTVCLGDGKPSANPSVAPSPSLTPSQTPIPTPSITPTPSASQRP